MLPGAADQGRGVLVLQTVLAIDMEALSLFEQHFRLKERRDLVRHLQRAHPRQVHPQGALGQVVVGWIESVEPQAQRLAIGTDLGPSADP